MQVHLPTYSHAGAQAYSAPAQQLITQAVMGQQTQQQMEAPAAVAAVTDASGQTQHGLQELPHAVSQASTSTSATARQTQLHLHLQSQSLAQASDSPSGATAQTSPQARQPEGSIPANGLQAAPPQVRSELRLMIICVQSGLVGFDVLFQMLWPRCHTMSHEPLPVSSGTSRRTAAGSAYAG